MSCCDTFSVGVRQMTAFTLLSGVTGAVMQQEEGSSPGAVTNSNTACWLLVSSGAPDLSLDTTLHCASCAGLMLAAGTKGQRVGVEGVKR